MEGLTGTLPAMASVEPGPTGRTGARQVNFDHVSIAVDELDRWSRTVSDELGMTLVEQDASRAFRYRLFSAAPGGLGPRLELLAPAEGVEPGFVNRFLERRGVGPHHLTFTVPDVEVWMARLTARGFPVVGVDLSNPQWREAFVPPDSVHDTVVQIADSVLLSSVGVPVEGAVRRAGLVATVLRSTDLETSRRLFGTVLEGVETRTPAGFDFDWPWGRLRVESGPTPGIGPLLHEGVRGRRLAIGTASFVAAEDLPEEPRP